MVSWGNRKSCQTEQYYHAVSITMQKLVMSLEYTESYKTVLLNWGHFFYIVKISTDFIFLGSKITADGDCSHEMKRCWLLGRKVMTNLDSILKSRDISPKKTYRWLTNIWKDAVHHSLSEKCKSKPQWGTISHQLEWLRSKSLQAINAGEGVEKREPSYTVGGNAN